MHIRLFCIAPCDERHLAALGYCSVAVGGSASRAYLAVDPPVTGQGLHQVGAAQAQQLVVHADAAGPAALAAAPGGLQTQ